VLELTEHHAVGDLRPLIDLRDRLRAKGALLALDDAGSGYSGLQQITQFRPQLIKLDRALVTGADGDEVKLALVEMLGEFGGRIDAWLLAEGIETWGELQAFLRLRVPLGQGWLLGRPGPPWVQLDPEVRDRLRRQAAQALLTGEPARPRLRGAQRGRPADRRAARGEPVRPGGVRGRAGRRPRHRPRGTAAAAARGGARGLIGPRPPTPVVRRTTVSPPPRRYPREAVRLWRCRPLVRPHVHRAHRGRHPRCGRRPRP
jgi:hypothetical protein